MLIQILTQKPEMIGPILSHTPSWVWGLLAALLYLGATQLVARTASLKRIVVMPVAMTGFAIYGMVSAFGNSGQLASVVGVWAVCAAATIGLGFALKPRTDVRYDAATQSFQLPGSWLPMALIVGIFLVKYAVGIELNMQPLLTHDTSFALSIAAVYGVFNGIFTTRALRLVRVAVRHHAAPSLASA